MSRIFLIKSIKPLYDLIAELGQPVAEAGVQIDSHSQGAVSEPPVEPSVPLLKVGPQLIFLVHIVPCPGTDGQYGGYGHHDLKVALHVCPELLRLYGGYIIIAEHELGHPDLLVYAAYHHILMDRLILSAYEVSVEVHIHVVEPFRIRQRIIYINIIYIKITTKSRKNQQNE